MFSFKIGNILIDSDIVFQWIIILVLAIGAYLLTRNLKGKLTKKEVVLEMLYDTVAGLVRGNIGESYMSYVPFIGSLMIYLLILNLVGLLGIMPPTKDLNVAIGLACISIVVIHFTAIKRNGVGGYLHGYTQPFVLMLPLNIMERIVFPVSLSLRLFGNMLAATLIIELLYDALNHVAWFAQLGIPIFAHAYFDVFDGTIQMIVFTMLTMVNIKMTAEH
ncbi:F0F1 ATP synthase subunit A [Clostridium tarantellae]|uniref:ATP synthase subunit a n=2 Tax=Clostridium tarantellae TaxID=39493 RepID=A0A6I1MGN5_9CLOT|nr:F0F1 ATP synthase subunit A [Clostridium tarantellae]